MLVRTSKSEKTGRKAIDATAGMSEDGFLLAAQGYEVIIFVTAYDQYGGKNVQNTGIRIPSEALYQN